MRIHHVYEIELESSHAWMKLQAACSSPQQAITMFESRFGGHLTAPRRQDLGYVTESFDVPRLLSESSTHIANWDKIKNDLPDGSAQQAFRLVRGPYAWCESLSDDCDCRGSKGNQGAVYCSGFGRFDEAERRSHRTPNTRWLEILQEMRDALTRRETAHLEQSSASSAVQTTSSEQNILYCPIHRHRHPLSEHVERNVETQIRTALEHAADTSVAQRRAIESNVPAIRTLWRKQMQSQMCAEALVAGTNGIPDVIYKYIPKHLLKKGAPRSLRATQLLSLNDYMECNFVTSRDANDDPLHLLDVVQSRLPQLLGIPVTEEELLERSQRFGDLRLSTYIQDYLNPHVGVVSLSTDYLVPTMWAHYARNTGIVVGYDTEALKSLGYCLRSVIYTEHAPVYTPIRDDVIRLRFLDRELIVQGEGAGDKRVPVLLEEKLADLNGGRNALSGLLLSKGLSWEYEKEVRLLIDLQDARDTGAMDCNGWPVKVIDIPPDAITHIYASPSTSAADLTLAAEIARGDKKQGLYVGHVSAHAYRMQRTFGTVH